MYLAAQRVRSGSRTGINAFLYRHPPGEIPWRDPARVVEQMPGELVSQDIEMPPGGNEVLSFLDVVAGEAVPKLAIVDQAEKLRTAVVQAGVVTGDGVGMRFSAGQPGTERSELEWNALWRKAGDLLANPQPLPPWRTGDGLIITRVDDGNDLVFALMPATAEKLRKLRGAEWKAPKLTVSRRTMDDLKRVSMFDAYEQIATVMTGSSLPQLLLFGRIHVENERGEVVWEWPAFSQGVGYCLTCHRQHTLVHVNGSYRCTNCGTEQAEDGRFVATLT